MICLGFKGMDHVISEKCYKGTTEWSFSYNSFVKIHGKYFLVSQNDLAISKSVLYKSVLYFMNVN